MKKDQCCYPVAIYHIYISYIKEQDEFVLYPYPQDMCMTPRKISNSELLKDGTIKYLPPVVQTFDSDKAKQKSANRQTRINDYMKKIQEKYKLKN